MRSFIAALKLNESNKDDDDKYVALVSSLKKGDKVKTKSGDEFVVNSVTDMTISAFPLINGKIKSVPKSIDAWDWQGYWSKTGTVPADSLPAARRAPQKKAVSHGYD